MRPHVYFHQLSSQTLWWAHATTELGQGTMEPARCRFSNLGGGHSGRAALSEWPLREFLAEHNGLFSPVRPFFPCRYARKW